MKLSPNDFPDWLFVEENGFSYPDWDGVGDVIAKECGDRPHGPSWDATAMGWCQEVANGTSVPCGVHKSKNFFVVSSAPRGVVKNV